MTLGEGQQMLKGLHTTTKEMLAVPTAQYLQVFLTSHDLL